MSIYNDDFEYSPYAKGQFFMFYELMRQGHVPPQMPFDILEEYTYHGRMEMPSSSFRCRERFVELGTWVLVHKAWTTPLAQWIGSRKVLELNAGAGWIAKALHEDGVDIIATDNNSESYCDVQVFPIEILDSKDAVDKYADWADIILTSWPRKVGYALEKWDGRDIIYLGESRGGCTGDDHFHKIFWQYREHMHDIHDWDPDDLFFRASNSYIPWWGMHDYLMHGVIKWVEDDGKSIWDDDYNDEEE